MDMARSRGYSAFAVEPTSFTDRALMRSVVRWAVLGAAGVIALIIALSHGMSADAAAPTTNCIWINYTTCVNYTYTTPTYVAPAYIAPTYVAPTYIAPSTSGSYLVRSTVDPRYCGGIVNIWNEGGNLIDRCPDGTRVFPVYPDYGYGYLGGNYLGANYLGVNYAGAYNFNYLNGNACNFNFNCGAFNTFPAGGTVVGGVVYYNDNRFCGDGKIAFVPGRGYFCQNGGPLMPNGVTTVNCGNFFLNGCGIWRGYEADAPAAPAAATQPQQVTTYAAPAVKAPVVAPAAPVVAPAAPVVAPAAPVSAKTATALNAPVYVPVGSTSDPTDRG
jgi:hypothetical protein